MSNWIKVRIEDIGEVVGGSTPSTKNDKYYGGDIAWITPKDLSNFDGRFISSGERNITEAGLESCSARLLPKHTVLFTSRAPIGYIAIASNDLATNQGFKSIIPNEKIDYLFLYYLLKYNKDKIESVGSGTTFKEVSGASMKKIEVRIPQDKREQKRIAAILSSLDDKIEINTRMNKVLEETARALFHRWFVEFEFPNEEGKPYKSSGGRMIASEMGEIPEGWRVMSLDQIADFMNGLACQKYPPQNDEEGLPVLKIRELRSANLSDADRVSSTVPKKYYVTDGDVIFSWSGSLIVDIWCSGLVILNQHLFKVTSDTYPKWFYYSWIEYHLSEFQGIASDKATTMGHIQRKHLTNSKVVVPPSEVLEKMNLIMEPLLEQMIRDKCENLYLCKCRDSLLPKLMNNTIGLD